MKLILATLFAFLALSMGFRSRLNNNMFMQGATADNDYCPSDCIDTTSLDRCRLYRTIGWCNDCADSDCKSD